MSEILPFQIVIIAVFSILSQWTAWRFKTPAIVFLLASGFVLGPILGWLDPKVLFGDFLEPAIAASVAIILFEGSLQLNFHDLRGTQRVVKRIILLGAPLGWALISIAAHYVAGLDWPTSITIGGILVVTGPTVIMPMLRHARLNKRVGSMLKWEGIANDPIGVIFAILAYEYFVSSSHGHSGLSFFLGNGVILAAIVLVSFAIAHLIKRLFERGHMPEYLKAPFLVSTVLSIFFISNGFLEESGLIAVTILGVTLTNIHTRSLGDIKRFKETITIILVSGVFIILTAQLELSALTDLTGQSLMFIALLLFVIRPLTIFLCTLGTNITKQEIILVGLIAPRGIVCAAMAGIIGPLLMDAGFASGAIIFPIAFAVVVSSVILHSMMVKPLAARLKLQIEQQNGVMIAGAYPWSIQLAQTLKSRDVPVIIIDNNWKSLSAAKLADIPIYHGELLSEETEFSLEFNAYNTLIAATTNPAYNALTCDEFGHEFGSERVFSVGVDEEGVAEYRRISTAVKGRPLLAHDVTLANLWAKFDDDYRFKITRVGKKEGEDTLIIPPSNEDSIHMGIISKAGLVSFYSEDPASHIAPKADDFILTLSKTVRV
tara:strand:+ start:20866 stop:22671 length:1806 start_codon:yes stop_codon:yes gene_type:complete